MSVMKKGKNGEFWDRWGDRFVDEGGEYITPFNKVVDSKMSNIDFRDCCMDFIRARDIWLYIYNNLGYKLSKQWRKPEETLKEGYGDCEDYDFLMASMLLNDGIEGFELSIGYLIYPDGTEAEHTWLIVDGEIMDPTGSPSSIEGLKYKKVKSFVIRMEQ